MKKCAVLFLCFSLATSLFAQPDRWQQRVKYLMDVKMNVETNQFTGKQKLEYWNNSPDTLTRVFYHLFFNAFQPGSMFDVRSRRQGTLQGARGADWDLRVKDRIQNLKPDEIGYQKVLSLKMNGRVQKFETLETILEVKLDKPILPKTKVVFEMEFEGQVPIQIRRSGRDNPVTKVRYSMSQWYPKLCEYDYEGWHPTPYVNREFYGVWGDFDVNITIDKSYVLGGTGNLVNANEIGYGYEAPGTKVVRPAGNTLTWKFNATNVHDFMWGADPEYVHIARKVRDNLVFHLLYKPSNVPGSDWEGMLDRMARALPYIEKTFGPYPYKQYSFVHGGDGGMEYPMATLLATPSGAMHEFMHSWYHGVLGSNETTEAWLDEGFANYAGERVNGYLRNAPDTAFAQSVNYRGYLGMVRSGKEEAAITPADHFNTNMAHSAGTYFKGAVFLEQLGYILGAQVRDQVLLDYYRQWKFKHPNGNDFLRVAEKKSNIELDWYMQYWINSTKTIDYAFDSLWEEGGKTKIRIKRVGLVPMPIDLQLTFKDGSAEMHYVPLDLMYGIKPAENDIPRTVYPAWKWTNETYVIESNRRLGDISIAEIDPSQRLADVERQNNKMKL